MKLIKNSKYLKLALTVIFLIQLFSISLQQCNSGSGCIQRNKFLVYTTSISNIGETSAMVSDVNYKVVYLLNTGISIMDSTNPNDKMMEQEVGLTYGTASSRLIRKIPYGQIVMDCGKFRNKLCEVENYPDKERLEKALDGIKKTMSENVETNCIVIPFFEFGYTDPKDKISLLCLPESKDLYDVVKYRDFLSSTIETIQINEANTRSSTFNGIERPVHKFITYKGDKTSVAVDVQVKSNIIYLNNEDYSFVRSYSLYELKNSDGFSSPITAAIARKPAKMKDWNLGLKPQPRTDCCLFLGGEAEDLLLCVADDNGGLEINDEVCSSEIKEVNKEIHDFVYRVKVLNAFTTLKQDETKRSQCSNSSWNVMRNRIQAASDWAVENCKKFFTNINDSKDNKGDKCKGQYLSILQHEQDFLTRKDKNLETAFKSCVKDRKLNLYNPDYLNKKIESLSSASSVSFFFKQKEQVKSRVFFDQSFPFFSMEEFSDNE